VDAGMTVTSAPPAGLTPYGMMETYFAGTYDGPGTLLVDNVTNYFFTLTGASLVGGAIKTVMM
jgi:hypothetical protein